MCCGNRQEWSDDVHIKIMQFTYAYHYGTSRNGDSAAFAGNIDHKPGINK